MKAHACVVSLVTAFVLMSLASGSPAAVLGTVGEGGAIACPEQTQLAENDGEKGRMAWCHTADGTAHGPAVTWGPDGARRSESHWLQGRKHGRDIEWDQTGVQREEVQWVAGERHGTSTSWYAGGAQRSVTEYERGKRHGRAAIWDESGTQIIEGTYEEDRKHGVWTFRGPGERAREAAFGVIVEDVDLTQGILQSPPSDCAAWADQLPLLRRGYLSVVTLLSLRAATQDEAEQPEEFELALCIARKSARATRLVDAACEAEGVDFIESLKSTTIELAIGCSP